MTRANPTHYETLDVAPSFPWEAIDGLRRSYSKIYHPDSGSAPDAARMKRINAACDVLGDPPARAQYDRELAARELATAQAREATQSSAPPHAAPPHSPPPQPAPVVRSAAHGPRSPRSGKPYRSMALAFKLLGAVVGFACTGLAIYLWRISGVNGSVSRGGPLAVVFVWFGCLILGSFGLGIAAAFLISGRFTPTRPSGRVRVASARARARRGRR